MKEVKWSSEQKTLETKRKRNVGEMPWLYIFLKNGEMG
jgi:hypothetical protein